MTEYVYLVEGDRGEYSDREQWVHGIFATLEDAQASLPLVKNWTHVAPKAKEMYLWDFWEAHGPPPASPYWVDKTEWTITQWPVGKTGDDAVKPART